MSFARFAQDFEWVKEGQKWIKKYKESVPLPPLLPNSTTVPTQRFVAFAQYLVKDLKQAAFEKTWADRKSVLGTLPGFRFFSLMRRVVYQDGDTYDHDVNYVAVSIWDKKEDYVRAFAPRTHRADACVCEGALCLRVCVSLSGVRVLGVCVSACLCLDACMCIDALWQLQDRESPPVLAPLSSLSLLLRLILDGYFKSHPPLKPPAAPCLASRRRTGTSSAMRTLGAARLASCRLRGRWRSTRS